MKNIRTLLALLLLAGILGLSAAPVMADAVDEDQTMPLDDPEDLTE